VALEEGLAPLPVARRDLSRSRSTPKLIAGIVADATAFAGELGVATGDLLIGGRSMGGRMCSMAVADGLEVAGLVLISYPLHPPGRPEKARTEHLADLKVPVLFVSGTRDAFGTPAELESATAAIPGPVSHAWIDGGDHGLRRKDDQVVAAVKEWIEAGFRGARRQLR
jgi:predicted alpha/beta-hydrolase family hydrolase